MDLAIGNPPRQGHHLAKQPRRHDRHRVAVAFAGRSRLEDAPVRHQHQIVRHLHRLERIMRDDKDRRPARPQIGKQRLAHPFPQVTVETGEGLIQQQQRG